VIVAKRKLSFSLTMEKGSEDVLRLAKEWPERMAHVAPMITYLSADYVRRHVQDRLGQDPSLRSYRDALEVAQVKGLKKGESAYSLHLNTNAPTARKVAPKRTLLEVRAVKRKTQALDPAAVILERYSPWTLDTLPFKPDRKDAVVIMRKASAVAVMKIAAERKRQQNRWSRELGRVGIRASDRQTKLNFPTDAPVPNMAADALTAEFGLGKKRPNPAWRLAVQRLQREALPAFLKDQKHFVFPLTRPSDKVWKTWPPPTKRHISAAQAGRYTGFQKRLGIRV
jgi:hypothetical protein